MSTLSQYYKRLRSFIRKRVMSVDEAEDILQTVFYQFAKANSLISPIEHVTAWLHQAARNQIVDHHRKKRRSFSAIMVSMMKTKSVVLAMRSHFYL